MGKIILKFDVKTLDRTSIYRQGLSLRAIAIYNALIDLSCRDDISVCNLTHVLQPATRYAISAAIKELESRNLFERCLKKERGVFAGVEYKLRSPDTKNIPQ